MKFLKKILIILVVLIIGCGCTISFHEVSREDLYAMTGHKVLGHAKWKEMFNEIVHCDIYMMPLEEYPSEECYDAVMEHELKHCDVGRFHDEGWNDPETLKFCYPTQRSIEGDEEI